METLLVKMFATALALSQVTTAPDAVEIRFDRTRDQPRVTRLLQAGCTHMRKAFDVEDINLDELIATALDDPQALSGEIKAFRGMNFADMQVAYLQFCKNEKVPNPAVDLGDVIDFYNKAVTDLPDHTKLAWTQAARRQHGARRQRRALRGGVRGEPTPRLGGARRHSRAGAAGVHCRGGQALLRAQRRRRARPDPRLHRQPRRVAAGRRAAPPSPSR